MSCLLHLQDNIVIHEPAYLDDPAASSASNLPQFDVKRIQEFLKHSTKHLDPLRPIQGGGCNHDQLRFRYPTASELRRAKGQFSNCTVPLILFSHWIHGFGGVM